MPEKKRTLIKNAKVHNGLGEVLEATDILIEDGKIKCIGDGLISFADEVIDASGCEVFPGFVSVLSCWGGIGPEMDGTHLSEHSDPVNPEMNVKYVFLVDSMTSSELYRHGITASCLAPDFTNLFGGLAAVYKTYGFQPDKMLIKEKAAEVGALSENVKRMHAGKPDMNTSMGIFHRFVRALQYGQSYNASKSYDDKGEALSAVVNGQLPFIIHTDSRSRYELLKAEMKAFPNIRYAINGIFDLNRKNDVEIAEGRQAAILNSIADSAACFDEAVRYDEINEMVEHGAKISLSPNFISPDMNHKEALLWNANMFYKNGVGEENVLKMITSIPAEILGVGDRIGSLKEGKDADLTIWSGNPITSFTAKLQNVFIDGEELSAKEKVRVCW